MDWLEILEKVFDIAIFPLLGALTLYLVTLIKAKKAELAEKTKNETTRKYLDLLETTIVDCVWATNQTYVETLKKEGIFDADAQKEAFNRTYKAVMAVLTDDAKEYLGTAINDLEAYITNKIEVGVATSKPR